MGLDGSKYLGIGTRKAEYKAPTFAAAATNPIQNQKLVDRIAAIDCELKPETRTSERGMGVYYFA